QQRRRRSGPRDSHSTTSWDYPRVRRALRSAFAQSTIGPEGGHIIVVIRRGYPRHIWVSVVTIQTSVLVDIDLVRTVCVSGGIIEKWDAVRRRLPQLVDVEIVPIIVAIPTGACRAVNNVVEVYGGSELGDLLSYTATKGGLHYLVRVICRERGYLEGGQVHVE